MSQSIIESDSTNNNNKIANNNKRANNNNKSANNNKSVNNNKRANNNNKGAPRLLGLYYLCEVHMLEFVMLGENISILKV